ncbi:hypothetical protein GOBAR_AA11467 [Gossypium barbadense]|uniref:Uncharacterized protein n=1 Tax=Gossypium barbadense TaxID=3634 RepID=A0A2P5Y0Q2_GOSBA|nr:hypothetical protein GOBAR_AA11467 [Gossypium barbadense]
MASIVTTTITNGAGQNLVLRLSNDGNPPPTIKNTQTATFPLAVPANYVNGALVYEVGNSLKWILFWTTDNQMSEDTITYAEYEYTAWASIGPNSSGQAASINARPVSK